MLRAFPDEYKGTAVQGPRIPEANDPKYAARMKGILKRTLKENNSGGHTFSAEESNLFPWYVYLFLDRGKPTTHLLALNALSADSLNNSCPEVLKRLFVRVKTLLNITE